MNKYYKIPDEYFHRIHFVRPRFKSNIENVLLYMANECCKIEPCTCEEYNKAFTKAIRLFPGNIDSKEKTIANWRTEIPALFSFYIEDKDHDVTVTSKMAKFLNERQDLTQFFKLFLYTFQFPGGHIKPKDNIELIERDVKFKPAKIILQVLLEGNKLLSRKKSLKEMSLSEEEATYCIFNDLRVTTGNQSPKEIAQVILDNRKNKLKYYYKKDPQIYNSKGEARTKGDVTRYAGDILDYMEIASLVVKRHNYYYLSPNAKAVIDIFVKDNKFFNGYDALYGKKNIELSEIRGIEPYWFQYTNDMLDPNLFVTDLNTVLGTQLPLPIIIKERIKDLIQSENTTTKDIGNIGETLIHGHEIIRLKLAGYENLAKLIQIVDSPSYHPGFDIDSFEGDGTNHHRYIEVKTTISRKKIQIYNFTMSTNEWSVADTNREHYYVYRLMLSEKERILYILKNPVHLYKTDQISAIPSNGMEINFDVNKFEPTQLLIE
ncbi:MAG: DUF3883 domain-containing protein [Bacteroidales bacterium]|nr:DUF3883 domain-containing protein [Bacteroidales bacterium]